MPASSPRATKAEPRRSGSSPRSDRARSRLVEAALDLFAFRGFDGVSTGDIASQAGMSQSVVLYHFGTKDALWREAMQLLWSRVAVEALPEAVLADVDVVSQLKIALRNLVLVAAKHPQLGRVMLWEGASGGERLEWLRTTLLAPHYDVFTRFVAAAADAGKLKRGDPVMIMIMAHSAAAMLFNLAPLTKSLLGRSPFEADIVREQADLLVSIFLTGLLKDDV